MPKGAKRGLYQLASGDLKPVDDSETLISLLATAPACPVDSEPTTVPLVPFLVPQNKKLFSMVLNIKITA